MPPNNTARTGDDRITSQVVGAYGERAVEAELLRRGWITTNVNTSIKNAADFDIFALKKHKAVQIRVKTCGPNVTEFQFSFRPNDEIIVDELGEFDFTVLVGMAIRRDDDFFYIVPTRIVRDVIRRHREWYLARPKRDGSPHKDSGYWTLRLADAPRREDRPGYGLERKWSSYKDNWQLLELQA